MGLDMYLFKRVYPVATIHTDGTIETSSPHGRTEVGYWRKSNQIHNWFVENVQGGVDDCEEYHVTYEQLTKLKELCLKVLETKRASLLPPTEGFFFGSTEIDDYYYDDLRQTVEIINKLEPSEDYYYMSSW